MVTWFLEGWEKGVRGWRPGLPADGVANLTDMDQVRVEQRIAASPEALYDMVSDVTRMGSWSPETTSARWLGGADRPAPGARFKGANKHGWRRWHTTCTVVAAEPGRRFSFDVGFGPLPISQCRTSLLPTATVAGSWKRGMIAGPAG
ncbi:MAG: hypothetical protein QOF30_2119 [Acidimicrobiaceae bacterium]|nr:hypothetical protein [Acidimicrobiaceae bacterium]